jgi:hypothetical protein
MISYCRSINSVRRSYPGIVTALDAANAVLNQKQVTISFLVETK